MWSIHDFPSYDFFAGYVIKRHVGCLPCDPNIKVHFVRKLKKMVYTRAHMYLPCNYPYKQAQATFNRRIKTKSAPTIVSIVQTIITSNE
jgi:hypothetical protein